jgi:hypothetical protein
LGQDVVAAGDAAGKAVRDASEHRAFEAYGEACAPSDSRREAENIGSFASSRPLRAEPPADPASSSKRRSRRWKAVWAP